MTTDVDEHTRRSAGRYQRTVPAGRARKRLRELHRGGTSLGDLARACETSVSTMHRIVNGTTKRIDATTEARVFAVPFAAASPGGLVDAHEAQVALDALLDAGWTVSSLALALAVPYMTVTRVARQSRCTRRVADLLIAFHDNDSGVNSDADEEPVDDPLAMLTWIVDDVEQTWRAHAACRELPGDNKARSDVFFPDRGGDVDTPRRICNDCPVRAECLACAMNVPAHQYEHGIWGGLSGTERRAFRHQERNETKHMDALDDVLDGPIPVPVSEQRVCFVGHDTYNEEKSDGR